MIKGSYNGLSGYSRLPWNQVRSSRSCSAQSSRTSSITTGPSQEHATALSPGCLWGSLHTRDGLFTNPTDVSYYGLLSNGALFPAQITDLTQNHPDLIRGVARAERKGVIKEIWISQGDEEPQALPFFTNALQPTLTFFDQNGITYTYVPGASIGAIYGHVWDTWRKDLVAFGADPVPASWGRHMR